MGRAAFRALSGGEQLILRPIAAEDKQLLVDAFERLSDDSRYRRFFAPIIHLSPSALRYLTEIDHTSHEAIIAIDPTTGAAVGVARYVALDDESGVAEAAVVMADDWQSRGLGRALLRRLVMRAAENGIGHFTALVKAANPQVVRLLAGLGDTETSLAGGEVELRISLEDDRPAGRLATILRRVSDGSLAFVHRLTPHVTRPSR